MAEDQAFYRIREVAAMYAIDEHTLRNWIKKGAIVATRLGPTRHTIRLSRAEVEKLGRETGRKAAS